MHGNGQQKRTFLYVKDFCDAVYRIIVNKKNINPIYNIGSHDELKNIEVVKLSSDEVPIIQLNTKILPIDLNEQSKLIEVSDDESVTKHVNVSVDYSTLSLKDLKQKVNDLGGPPLKTKNALLNFLKNKV